MSIAKMFGEYGLGHFMIVILVLFISVDAWAFSSEKQVDDYQAGIEVLKNGNYEAALDIWELARNDSAKNANIDSRIGFKYIEVVTKHKLRDRYREACEMYHWALSTSDIEKNYEPLKTEIKRLKPILGDKKYREINKLLKNNNPEALSKIKGFWIKIDPSSDKEYNERLIEHWERISFAKEHFNDNSTTVYKTDDRGLIYVKYGRPDYVNGGTLNFNYSEVKGWARELTRLSTVRKSNLFSNSQQQSTNSASNGGSLNPNSDFGNSNIILTESVANDVTRMIRQYFVNPRYSIWIYRKINEDEFNNVIYIFGEGGNGGRFKLRRSINEFIPPNAYRRVNRLGSTDITPAIILQLMIYDEFSIVDPYFNDMFNSLQSSLFQIDNPVSSQLAFKQKTDSEFELNKLQASAPPLTSSYEKTIPELDLKYRQFRMLDDNNNPYMLTVIGTYPQEAFIFSSAQDQVRQIPIDKYLMNYSIQFWDKDWNFLSDVSSSPKINSKLYNLTGDDEKRMITSVIRMSYDSRMVHQKLSAELKNPEHSNKISENVFPEGLRGRGQKVFQIPSTLSTDPQKLEMADVVLGYKSNIDQGNKHVPFFIHPENKIPINENLMVHFEIYHLKQNPDGKSKFQLKYQLKSKKSGKLLSNIFKGQDKESRDVSLTLNYESLSTNYRDNIELKTKKLKKGTYILEIVAVDQISNSKITRKTEFYVE